MLLSVVVPCYNEEEVLPQTHPRLAGVLAGIAGIDFEIIYVDDGSADGTAACLHRFQLQDPHVRVVRLSRNFGHQIAVTAGLDHSRGDAVVIIDSDLQDPPEVIEEMVARWKEGCEVAYGLRVHREGETQFKLLTAKLFYRLINRSLDRLSILGNRDSDVLSRAANFMIEEFLVLIRIDRILLSGSSLESQQGRQELAVFVGEADKTPLDLPSPCD